MNANSLHLANLDSWIRALESERYTAVEILDTYAGMLRLDPSCEPILRPFVAKWTAELTEVAQALAGNKRDRLETLQAMTTAALAEV